jgi:RNA polymerase primary sigma factor
MGLLPAGFVVALGSGRKLETVWRVSGQRQIRGVARAIGPGLMPHRVTLSGNMNAKPRMHTSGEAESTSSGRELDTSRRAKRVRVRRPPETPVADNVLPKPTETRGRDKRPLEDSIEPGTRAEEPLPSTERASENGALDQKARKPRKQKLQALTNAAKERIREEQRRQQLERESAAAEPVFRDREATSPTSQVATSVDRAEAYRADEKIDSIERLRSELASETTAESLDFGEDQRTSTTDRPRRDSLYDYLDEIRRYELIEHEEEIALAREIQELNRMEQKRQELEKKLQRAPTHQEWAQAMKYKSVAALREALTRGHRARNRLVTSNLRLVNAIVNRFSRRAETLGITISDLMQEGSIGLIRAAERYDGSRGYRFSTFASWWIRASIFRTLDEASRLIRLPSRVTDAYQRLRKLRRNMTIEQGREPSERELAESAGMTPDKVRFIFEQVNRQVLSYDRGIDATEDPDTDSSSFLESIADPRDEEDLVDSFMKDAVLRLLRSVLNDREIFVLTMRFGLEDDSPKTLQEVASVLNVSKERVRQISFAALAKLRKSSAAERLRTEFAEYL